MSICSNINDPVNEQWTYWWGLIWKECKLYHYLWHFYYKERENEWLTDWINPSAELKALSLSFFCVLHSYLLSFWNYRVYQNGKCSRRRILMMINHNQSIREFTFCFCYVGSMTWVFCSSLARVLHALWQSFLECPKPIYAACSAMLKEVGTILHMRIRL